MGTTNWAHAAFGRLIRARSYRFGGHPGGVNVVRFSPDGKFIATGGVVHSIETQLGGLNVWGASDGKLVFSDEKADVYSLAFAPDGKTFATGGYKGSRIDIYSLEDKCKLRTLTGHSRFISDLAYSPDGKLLASAGRDGVLRLWSMIEGVPAPQIVSDNAFADLRHVEWSKDGLRSSLPISTEPSTASPAVVMKVSFYKQG